MPKFSDHPRGHVVKPDGRDRHGNPRYRAQIQDLKVGDVLAGFGRVLEWEEVASEDGWRCFRMRTEHPQLYPAITDTLIRPAYVYFGITSLAD
ncbi:MULTISPECIES: hypothetical protein [unclassified Streptomyces]|uniref:hypothetical protein n=1 Tax=unclassified Streptomyces TaxID=2593676 RepID=UPI00339E1E20